MPEDENRPRDTEINSEMESKYFADTASLEADEPRRMEQPEGNEYPSSHSPFVEEAPDATTAKQQPIVKAPIQTATTATPELKPASQNTPGVLILQWLTYAFWGWTLVALYWLTSLSVQYFVSDANETDSYSASYLNDMLAYSLAAVVVLFVISIICDVAYSRFEPRHKSGAAMVIMIIHAVIFALCGIGSLIVAVFAVVNMLISGQNEAASTTLITAGIMTVLYAGTLIRTLNPEKIKNIAKLFWVVMLVATVAVASLGIVGPAAYAQRTKDDRAIEAALPSIATAVNDYTKEQGKLPSSLEEVKLLQSYPINSDEDAKRLIADDLVKYTAKEKIIAPVEEPWMSPGVSVQTYPIEDTTAVYHYQLCVNYDTEKESDYNYDYDRTAGQDQEYETMPETSYHSAGKVCYDLQTDYSY